MTDYEQMIESYSSGFENLIYYSFYSVAITAALFTVYYVLKSKKKKRELKEADLKLEMYFEKYSDIIADKVIEKLKETQKKETTYPIIE